jgi:hypothetical protein
MKKIFIIFAILLSPSLFGQVVQTPITLVPPIEPLMVPPGILVSGYEVISFELKVEGYPPIQIKGNDVNIKPVREFLQNSCKEGCVVYVRKMKVRRVSDGQVMVLDTPSYGMYVFNYYSEQ